MQFKLEVSPTDTDALAATWTFNEGVETLVDALP